MERFRPNSSVYYNEISSLFLITSFLTFNAKLFHQYVKMGSTLRIIVFVILYLAAEANSANRALIFNRDRQSLISTPNTSYLSNTSVNCDWWVIACPSNGYTEEAFNVKYSVYNNALFVKKKYNQFSQCENLDEAVCDKPYEISMMYSDKSKKYEFGYEVFYENNAFLDISPVPFYACYPMKKFEKYDSLTMLFKAFKKYFDDLWERRKINQLVLHVGMEFLWIPLFKVQMNYLSFRSVEYEIRKNNINPMLPCHDYSLGNEMWDSKEVDTLYSSEVQKEIFEEIDNEVPEGACESGYECLTKWPLLPTDQFQFGSDSVLKCSNITTVPIWKSTLEKIMMKLDKYLYALQRITGQPLRIIAGVNQILRLANGYWFKKVVNLQHETIKFQIETPKIIYKMVKFKINPCKEGENCWYGVMIVIHNGPSFNKKDLICEDGEYQAGELGWEEIRYETWSSKGARSKFIYVCEISKKTMNYVGLTYTKDDIYQPLSLLKFPTFDKDEQKIIFKSFKEDIFNEMVRLDEPGAEVKLDDGLIERPSINDNFGTTDEDDSIYDKERGESNDSDQGK